MRAGDLVARVNALRNMEQKLKDAMAEAMEQDMTIGITDAEAAEIVGFLAEYETLLCELHVDL